MKRHFPVLLLTMCAVIFGGTFYLLLRDRFESGDVYPPSSSLRSDPLGTMILFESLEALPGVRVERDHNAANRLPKGYRTTYLHFAAESTDWMWMPAELYRTIDRFLLEGGRLVITLTPGYVEREEPEIKDKEKRKEEDKKPVEKSERKTTDPEDKLIDLEKKWGLNLTWEPGKKDANVARNISSLPLPQKLDWHGHITIQDTDASWQIFYETDHGPVLAERKRGPGSIVIATDSFFVSNEALVRDRQPELLAWLVGSSDHIVFDEAHFGILESPGIAALARKYRLHGGIAALIVLAGLFMWKNSSSLAPRRMPEGSATDVISGRAAGAGFVSLLRRNISPDRVLNVCLEEWKRTFARSSRFTPREKAVIEEISREEEARPARDRDPVATYRKICASLRRRSS